MRRANRWWRAQHRTAAGGFESEDHTGASELVVALSWSAATTNARVRRSVDAPNLGRVIGDDFIGRAAAGDHLVGRRLTAGHGHVCVHERSHCQQQVCTGHA